LSLDVAQPSDLQSTEEPMNVGEYKRKLTELLQDKSTCMN
jgi:hypothetical protein